MREVMKTLPDVIEERIVNVYVTPMQTAKQKLCGGMSVCAI